MQYHVQKLDEQLWIREGGPFFFFFFANNFFLVILGVHKHILYKVSQHFYNWLYRLILLEERIEGFHEMNWQARIIVSSTVMGEKKDSQGQQILAE